MKIKTPGFWYKNTIGGRLLAFCLLPFSALYYLGHRLHQLGKPWRASIPVWCIGNLVAGGGGKTPTALALMALIREHKLAKNPCFLSRGYGGSARGALLVDPAKHYAALVGDEPLLLARAAPTIISADRAVGARLAEQKGFDLIVMDDGLQNRDLAHDLNFLVIDAISGFGNGFLLPAGPLRQPAKLGMKNMHAVILIGSVDAPLPVVIPDTKPIFRASLTPESSLDLNTTYLAFTGLARPEKFRSTLLDLGVKLAAWHAFPDHYAYTTRDAAKLKAEAVAKNAILLTTEKDAVRMPHIFMKSTHVAILPVHLTWQNPASFANFLKTPRS